MVEDIEVSVGGREATKEAAAGIATLGLVQLALELPQLARQLTEVDPVDPRVVLARVAVDQRVDGTQLLGKLEDRIGLGAGRRVCSRRRSAG